MSRLEIKTKFHLVYKFDGKRRSRIDGQLVVLDDFIKEFLREKRAIVVSNGIPK